MKSTCLWVNLFSLDLGSHLRYTSICFLLYLLTGYYLIKSVFYLAKAINWASIEFSFSKGAFLRVACFWSKAFQRLAVGGKACSGVSLVSLSLK